MSQPATDHHAAPVTPRFLVTAEEAYPAFEDAVLDAQDSIIAGFRIFDFSTRLRSTRAQAIGRDWFDLILDALNRGVSVRLMLSDFDPVVGEALHADSWRAVRIGAALRELAPEGADVHVSANLHPARLTGVARLALWPKVQVMLSKRARAISAMTPDARAQYLRDRPGLAAQLVEYGDGVRPRHWMMPELAPVTHHQKVAVIDRRRLYCGGLDLNERRYDTKLHQKPAATTWHDVQLMLDDPRAAGQAAEHLEDFIPVTRRMQTARRGDGTVLRTLSKAARGLSRVLAPRKVLSEIEAEILDGIASADRLIYIETQFMRDRRIARALQKAAKRAPSLQLFMVLPAAPEDVAFERNSGSDARFGEYLQARCIRRIRQAFGSRAFIGSPVQPRPSQSGDRDTLYGAPLIYVHSKVCLFDDKAGLVSSANLNGRSLRWDTEFGVPLRDTGSVVELRTRLLQHWLGETITGDAARPFCALETCVDAWRAQAAANTGTPPKERGGFLVPYKAGPGRRFGRDIPLAPDELV
ncbi:phospholipase D-like domain-containing protein [Jannaschia sp. 2305UL9-9]|uniref:phospholipase D-like domain-containing protein n=1 Tax=Jannaschia sp. 2305UL9-9 TaxID=3121638 RepID=UPI0035287342